MTEIVNICAPELDVYSGYGRMACALLETLNDKGIRTNAIWRNSGLLDTHSDKQKGLIKQPIIPAAGGICLGYPTIIPRYGNLIMAGNRICVTMFESSQLPTGWVAELNSCKAVIVPTNSQAQIFKSNGVAVPIHVIPLGIGETFHYVERPTLNERPYTFVTWGDRGFRKGWNDAIQAFIGAFGDREDVQLIIKCRSDSEMPDFTNANIHTWRVDFDEPQLQEFYANADCMVFPSYGEGFGLPPREFAATGGLVMATEWWADDIAEWGIPIGYALVPAWRGHPEFQGLGQWANPHHFQLMALMRGFFEKARESDKAREFIQDMCKHAAVKVKERWTWAGFAEQVYAVWKEVNPPRWAVPVEVNPPELEVLKAEAV
jgi:glycosyltransferase involved in cell wall biosynthesis